MLRINSHHSPASRRNLQKVCFNSHNAFICISLYYIFMLRTEAYKSTLGLLPSWLTYSFTHSSVRIMLLNLAKASCTFSNMKCLQFLVFWISKCWYIFTTFNSTECNFGIWYNVLSMCIYHRSIRWLTDWLTHSSVRIMLLKTNKGGKIKLWPNSYKVSGSKSLRQRSLEATTWIMSGSCQGDLSFDSSTSLNYIEQFCHGFILHPQDKFVLF